MDKTQEKYSQYKNSVEELLSKKRERELTNEEQKMLKAYQSKMEKIRAENPEFEEAPEDEAEWNWQSGEDYEYWRKEEKKDHEQAKKKKEANRKRFLRGTKVLLTYPHFQFKAGTEGLELVLDLLVRRVEDIDQRVSIAEYVIARENHIDGSQHCHAFLSFNQRMYFSPTDFDIPDETWDEKHCNVSVGVHTTLKAIIKYCTKEGDFITNIDLDSYLKKKGKNTEIFQKSPTKAFEDGDIRWDQFDKFIKCKNLYQEMKNQKNFEQYEKENLPKKRHFWIFGKTNTGKTTLMNQFIKEHEGDVFKIPYNNDWTHYAGQRYLCIDGFKGQLTIQTLELICDGNTQFNTKGGSRIIAPPKELRVYSNYCIKDCYQNTLDVSPLLVRFTEQELTHVYA